MTMSLATAIETITTAGKAMHDGYVALGKTSAPWPTDLAEQIATGLFARQKLFSGRHARADLDEAAEIIRAEIMAGRMPTMH